MCKVSKVNLPMGSSIIDSAYVQGFVNLMGSEKWTCWLNKENPQLLLFVKRCQYCNDELFSSYLSIYWQVAADLLNNTVLIDGQSRTSTTTRWHDNRGRYRLEHSVSKVPTCNIHLIGCVQGTCNGMFYVNILDVWLEVELPLGLAVCMKGLNIWRSACKRIDWCFFNYTSPGKPRVFCGSSVMMPLSTEFGAKKS